MNAIVLMCEIIYSKDGKMKKTALSLCVLMTAAFLLTGCLDLRSPSKLLQPESDTTDDSKIVTFHVVGKGLEPENATTRGEAKLMAERAAVADGYRQLAEKIRGVYVDAYLKSGRGTVNYDVIQTKTQTWLRGTEIIEISDGEYGITTAHMRIRINFTKDDMIWWPVGVESEPNPFSAPS